MAQLPSGDPAPEDGSLPETTAENSHGKSLHAYLHIPFCAVRCGYCDFNTYTSSELRGVTKSSFLEDLLKEIELSKEVLSRVPSRSLSTIFFGGGTPTQLEAAQLNAALNSLGQTFGIRGGAEITTEANPDNITEKYLETLSSGGFNRLSLGMQSAVPSVLKTLDRTHDPDNVAKAVASAKKFGMQVSVDLIYGTPGETMDDWRTSVESALNLDVDHISAYSLIVEPGTKMHRLVSSGKLVESDSDEQADKYLLADELFSAAGFNWYEVSNWSKSNATRSKHNLAYWQSNDWWGYGPGAHSHVGGVRWWNQKHPATYSAALAAGKSPALAREVLDGRTRDEERILLEIRIAEGVDIELLKQVNPDAGKVVADFIADETIDPIAAFAGRLQLTQKGRLLADALVRDLLA